MKGKLEKIRVLNKKQSHINDYFVRIKFVWKILLADISFFKHFKLQQFNISLSFFVQSDLDVFQLPWIPHIEYRYKSNKFSTNLS